MLLIYTNNPKEQAQLEEEFDSNGEFFAVPFENTDKIVCILESMIFELFGKSESDKSFVLSKSSLNIIEKMKLLIQGLLDQKFSLSAAREILSIIKRQEKKIALYEEYIISLDHKLESETENGEEYEEMFLDQQVWQKEISKLFYDVDKKSQKGMANLEIEIEEIEINTKVEYLENDSYNFTGLGKILNSDGSVSETVSPKNEDTSTMCTLKSEFESLQRFSISDFHQIEQLNFDDEKLNESFDYSAREDSDEESQYFENVSKVTLYYPPEKENEQLHKKITENLVPLGKRNSDFIDLSGRLHPARSFLYDESIGEMIVSEEKEDIRKSNILKQSIHLSECSKKSSGSEKKYTTNLRAIKYQNKLRKGSKRSVATKRDLSEIEEEILKAKEKKDEKPKRKQIRLSEGMVNEEEKNEEIVFEADWKKRNDFLGEEDGNVKMVKSEVYSQREKSKFFKFKNVGS